MNDRVNFAKLPLGERREYLPGSSTRFFQRSIIPDCHRAFRFLFPLLEVEQINEKVKIKLIPNPFFTDEIPERLLDKVSNKLKYFLPNQPLGNYESCDSENNLTYTFSSDLKASALVNFLFRVGFEISPASNDKAASRKFSS